MMKRIIGICLITTFAIAICGCSLFLQQTNGVMGIEFDREIYTMVVGEQLPIIPDIKRISADSLVTVEYSIEDSSVAEAFGTDKIVIITALHVGRTFLIAKAGGKETKVGLDVQINRDAQALAARYIKTQTSIIVGTEGNSRSLSAYVVAEQNGETGELAWVSLNPNVARITGSGPEVLIEYVAEGSTAIVITHPDILTVCTILIQVDTADVVLTMNKPTISLIRTKDTKLRVTMTGANSYDYSDIIWEEVPDAFGGEILTLLGFGQEISIIGNLNGFSNVVARLPNGSSTSCRVTVDSDCSIYFVETYISIAPGETTTLHYVVVPDTATVTIANNATMAVNTYHNPTDRTVLVTGVGVGMGQIQASVTGRDVIAKMNVSCGYDISMEVGQVQIPWSGSGSPRLQGYTSNQTWTIPFTISPPDDTVQVSVPDTGVCTASVNNEAHTVTVMAVAEGNTSINLMGESGQLKTIQISLLYNYINEPTVVFKTNLSPNWFTVENTPDWYKILGATPWIRPAGRWVITNKAEDGPNSVTVSANNQPGLKNILYDIYLNPWPTGIDTSRVALNVTNGTAYITYTHGNLLTTWDWFHNGKLNCNISRGALSGTNITPIEFIRY